MCACVYMCVKRNEEEGRRGASKQKYVRAVEIARKLLSQKPTQAHTKHSYTKHTYKNHESDRHINKSNIASGRHTNNTKMKEDT